MTFDDLQFKPHHFPMMGKQAYAFFSNGYGASVIQGDMIYGGPEGLYEIAVLEGNTNDYKLTYETPITDDVIGHLTASEVTQLLVQIAALPPRTNETLPPHLRATATDNGIVK